MASLQRQQHRFEYIQARRWHNRLNNQPMTNRGICAISVLLDEKIETQKSEHGPTEHKPQSVIIVECPMCDTIGSRK